MLGYFISAYILNRQPDRENKMRYNEHQVNNPPEKKEKKERELTKPGQYTGKDLENTKKRPFLGGR